MTSFIQETDSKLVFPVSEKRPDFFPIRPVNETIGGNINIHFFPIPHESKIFQHARETIKLTENQDVANESTNLLLLIQDVLKNFQLMEFDIGYIPQLRAFNVDDGSVLLEWVYKDFRLGFTIEPISQESGWYIITNEKLGNISASGYLFNDNKNPIILWLINFVLVNS